MVFFLIYNDHKSNNRFYLKVALKSPKDTLQYTNTKNRKYKLKIWNTDNTPKRAYSGENRIFSKIW